MASLSDILTAAQGIVTAINNLGLKVGGVYNNLTTASLFQGALATPGPAVIYTATSAAASHIDYILFCNTTGASIGVSMSVVPPGGTASAANAIFSGMTIPANVTETWTGRIIVPAGYTVQAGATATGVAITMSGGASV